LLFLILSPFHSSSYHPLLPSFPTRRSSDLAFLGMAYEHGVDKIVLADHAVPSHGLADWIEQLMAESTGKSGRGLLPVVADPDALDRKSTRLNSSHVSISYAVFCLNKKRTLV